MPPIPSRCRRELDMNDFPTLKIARIGCGAGRKPTAQLAAGRPDRFSIVAGADPLPERVEKVRRISGRPDFRGFASAEALLAAGHIADVMIVATQDNDHFTHCRGALACGYDVLLEKPIATRLDQVLEIERLAAGGGTARDGLLRAAIRGILPQGQGDHRLGRPRRDRVASRPTRV